jgi:hypothetical protein
VAESVGKKWEKVVQRGLKKAGAWVYRLRDCPTSWARDEASGDVVKRGRFTPVNIADFIAFLYDTIFVIECKTVAGKSIRWDVVPDKRMSMLCDAADHDGVEAGILVHFRGDDKVAWIDPRNWMHERELSEKKSFNTHELEAFADEFVWYKNARERDWEKFLVGWLRNPDQYRRVR